MSETLKPTGKKKSVSKEDVKKFERKMARSTKVNHDLFVLDIVNTRKNMSYSEEESEALWEAVPHKHYFHSVTSDGKALKNSAPSAGHFHEVFIEENEDGEITSAKCGPPMVMHKGKPHAYKNDNHSHEMSYIASEVVERRVSNNDAVKVMTAMNAEEASANNAVRGVLK